MLKNMFALIGVASTLAYANKVRKGVAKKMQEENEKADLLMKNSALLGPIWSELNEDTQASMRSYAKNYMRRHPEIDPMKFGFKQEPSNN